MRAPVCKGKAGHIPSTLTQYSLTCSAAVRSPSDAIFPFAQHSLGRPTAAAAAATVSRT